MATVSVTVTSAGEASVTLSGDTLTSMEAEVEALWKEGYLSVFKKLADLFKDAPLAGVESVTAVIPEAEVIAETVEPKPQGTAGFPAGF